MAMDGGPSGRGIKRGESGASSASILANLGEALEDEHVDSSEVADVIAQRVHEQYNREGIDDFDGLSAEQMRKFLYFPLETPDLVTFPSPLDEAPGAPLLTLFMLLAESIGAKGVKPTVTGNLPRRLCQEVALAFFGEEEYRARTRHGEIRSEVEFTELNITRVVAEGAGLIRRYRGKFILGRECRKIVAGEGGAGIYPRLFRTFAHLVPWSYGYGGGATPLIQQSFLFSLFLLQKYGGEWRSNRFYEDRFLRAFPRVVHGESPYGTSLPEVVRRRYSKRCLDTFARLLGLVEIARVEWDYEEFRLRKLPLLESAVRFNLPGVL